MGKKTDIWMPVFASDFLVDTADLTPREVGIYFRLLCHYWKQQGPLGDDTDRLRRLAGVERDEIKILDYVLDRFFTHDDEAGVYRNKRADEEIENAQHRKEVATQNGSKGGRPRKNPEKTHGFSEENPQESQGKPEAKAKPNPKKSSSPSPSPIRSSTNVDVAPRGLSPMKDPLAQHYQERITDAFPHEAWRDYGQERKHLNNLARKTRSLLPKVPFESEEQFADAVLWSFWTLKTSEKGSFWATATCTPSSIAARWDAIIDNLAQYGAQAEEYVGEEIFT